jgi:hypothetical protein
LLLERVNHMVLGQGGDLAPSFEPVPLSYFVHSCLTSTHDYHSCSLPHTHTLFIFELSVKQQHYLWALSLSRSSVRKEDRPNPSRYQEASLKSLWARLSQSRAIFHLVSQLPPSRVDVFTVQTQLSLDFGGSFNFC